MFPLPSPCEIQQSHGHRVCQSSALLQKKTTLKKQQTKKDMSILLNQCPSQIQTITSNRRIVRYNTWGGATGGKGMENGSMIISSADSPWSALLKCSIKTALEVQQKRFQSTTSYPGMLNDEKVLKNVIDHGMLSS